MTPKSENCFCKEGQTLPDGSGNSFQDPLDNPADSNQKPQDLPRERSYWEIYGGGKRNPEIE